MLGECAVCPGLQLQLTQEQQCQPCSVMEYRRVDAGYKLVGDVFKKQSVKRERLSKTTSAALEAKAIDTCI